MNWQDLWSDIVTDFKEEGIFAKLGFILLAIIVALVGTPLALMVCVFLLRITLGMIF